MFLLLRGAEVYAPQPLGRCDVLIAGGRIARIAPHIALTRRSLPELSVRSLSGLALAPGFIDGHVHIAGGGGEGGFQHRTPPVHLQALAPKGTTRVVGLLGTDAVTRTVAELLAEARRLTALGISAAILTGAYQLPIRTLTGSVRSDLVLIPEVLGAGEIAIADDRGSHPTGRDLLEIASEVRVGALLAGKKGLLHMHVGDGTRRLRSLHDLLRRSALPNDLFSATHLNRNPDLLAEAPDLTRRGAYADLTADIFPAPGDDKPVDPAAALAHLLREGDKKFVTMSSDGNGSSPVFDGLGRLEGIGVGAPGRLHWALQRAVVKEGVPLEQALATVTANVASALGLEDAGRIAVGCTADLVALGSDLSVAEVYARGRLAARRGQLTLPDPFAPSSEARSRSRVENVSDKSPSAT